MTVAPGDLIHADHHGAVVVPHHAAADIKKAVERLTKAEARLIGPSQQADFTIEQLITILDPQGRDH
jgi:regulator of RNase E activity RraA